VSGVCGGRARKPRYHDGELTASLAHEIEQPIAAAVTNANTCLRWLIRDQPDVAEAREAT